MSHRIYHFQAMDRSRTDYPWRGEFIDITPLPGVTWSHFLTTYRWLRRNGMGKFVARETFWKIYTPDMLATVKVGCRVLTEAYS